MDFIVYGAERFFACEVKHARRVHRSDLRALKAFRDDYPEAELTLIYLGRERLAIDGITIVPVDAFLQELRG